ncbi:transcriptional regulator [Candidatus Aciduliprofundum boonei]|uniref:Transcriptional regulator n=1 Tax=Aciduliprofundum boonei (strain DSM 19572 / T469) TaxID=439481 RepID=D3TCB6_ACIB4|nr:transcriptional regulator [Candidatus Aciduliprofundum boonei]ADD08201.1 putative transcriptional regulator [Aciduliprofundum boonei T469]
MEKFQSATRIIAHRRKQKTREKVLGIIKSHGKIRFKELMQESGLSNRWLSITLHELLEEGLIKQVIGDIEVKGKNGEPVLKKRAKLYTITKKGDNVYSNAWYILHKLEDLRERGSTYYHNDFELFGVDIIMNGVEGDAFNTLPTIPEYEFFIMRSIFRKVGAYDIKNLSGEVIIALNFDMHKLIGGILEIKDFIKMLIKNADVFESDLFRDMGWRDKIHKFIHLLNYSKLLVDNKDIIERITKNGNKLFLSYKPLIISSYYRTGKGLDEEILEKVKEHIENDTNPLEDENIKHKLIRKSGNITEFPIYDYLNLLKVFNLTNYPFLQKIELVNEKITRTIENGGI